VGVRRNMTLEPWTNAHDVPITEHSMDVGAGQRGVHMRNTGFSKDGEE